MEVTSVRVFSRFIAVLVRSLGGFVAKRMPLYKEDWVAVERRRPSTRKRASPCILYSTTTFVFAGLMTSSFLFRSPLTYAKGAALTHKRRNFSKYPGSLQNFLLRCSTLKSLHRRFIYSPAPCEQLDLGLKKHIQGAKGNCTLWIDLHHCQQCGVNDQMIYTSTSQDENPNQLPLHPQARTQNLLSHIERFVQEDLKQPPSQHIDSVLWRVNNDFEPTPDAWRALDGLSPKHLTLIGGDYEDCSLAALSQLKHQWSDLHTLTLAGISSTTFAEDAPRILSRISSLTLDHCYGLHFVPLKATQLKELTIIENNACDIFISGIKDNPRLVHTLETLQIISSSSGNDFSYQYEPRDFRNSLKKCASLRQFAFSTSHADSLDTYLSSYLPLSIEHLTLHFTLTFPFLHHFDDWIHKASDPLWLPYLKSFEMTASEYPVTHSPPQLFDAFVVKRQELYRALKHSRPTMEIST
ncbi:hypothetical protein CVT26_011578 [Gymnopilus dilepis]|uniref:Uncharacterized protein n=1 Tax=Gymnopilus dilepis TaxID=231916 RepID=A0A409YQN4_9AGAR|nr:hypothetical protein CVT26_011578 [Gymnopilus dilepis]